MVYCLCSTDFQIVKQPQSGKCKYGDKVVLSVSAVGHGPLSYVWKKDENDITHPECTGVNTNSLTITFFSSIHVGSYSCVIKDDDKSLTSQSANLTLSKHYNIFHRD
jgi:hypothetical protein